MALLYLTAPLICLQEYRGEKGHYYEEELEKLQRAVNKFELEFAQYENI
jgi:hypothetical protein